MPARMRRRGASDEQIFGRAERCDAAERAIASGGANALSTKPINEKLPDEGELDIIRARMRR